MARKYFMECLDCIEAKNTKFANKIKQCVYILAKIGKTDMCENYLSQIISKKYDSTVIDVFKGYRHLIKSIEQFQCGLWLTSAQTSMKFLSYYMKYEPNTWLREFERSCYCTIACHCIDTYLPVNSLNYVHPEAHISQDLQIDPYYTILIFERQINFQKTTDEEFNKTMVGLFNCFEEELKKLEDGHEVKVKQLLCSVFNIVGTLVANYNAFSNDLIARIKKAVKYMNESEYLDQENVDKFNEYFGTTDAIFNFRHDFLEVSDSEKNDTLYYNIEEGVQNQYFVQVKFRPFSEEPDADVANVYDQFMREKALKMVASSRLAKRLSKLIKNKKLEIKTTNLQKQRSCLSQSHLIWLSKIPLPESKTAFRLLCESPSTTALLKNCQSLMQRLYNIFSNHYTIKNSFDTHFVVGSIERMNEAIANSRDILTQKIKEIIAQKEETTYNPFIEIDEHQEEAKFVDISSQDQMLNLQKCLEQILLPVYQETKQELEEWLSTKSSPELLNLQAKQYNLKQKLKWERMFNSEEKLFKLRKAIRAIHRKR